MQPVKIMILKFYLSLLKDKYKMVLDDQRSLIAIQGPKSVDILNQILENSRRFEFYVRQLVHL